MTNYFSALPGFPTLKNISFSSELRIHGVNVFGMESRFPSMVFELDPDEVLPTP